MSEYGVKEGHYIFPNVCWYGGDDYHLQVVKVTKKTCTIIDHHYGKEEKNRITLSQITGAYLTMPSTDGYGNGGGELHFERAKYYTPEQYEDHYHVEGETIWFDPK